jgi:hypothetical protein
MDDSADPELVPNDGSESSRLIRQLAATLDCDSELCIINNNAVKSYLGTATVEEELKRFKVPGPRNMNIGTDNDLSYHVLKKWSKLFKYFYPLEPTIYTSKFNMNTLDEVDIIGIFKGAPNIKAIGADITVSIRKNDTGWHSIGVFIDIRGDEDEEWSIEHFDSGGCPPSLSITRWMEMTAKKLRVYRKEIGLNGDVITTAVTNKLTHQNTCSECGLHTLIFIRRRLEGIGHRMFSQNKISDKYAKEFRRHIFI